MYSERVDAFVGTINSRINIEQTTIEPEIKEPVISPTRLLKDRFTKVELYFELSEREQLTFWDDKNFRLDFGMSFLRWYSMQAVKPKRNPELANVTQYQIRAWLSML